MPTENDFELVEVDIPDLKGGEFLVHNIWMSVDPYMRGRMGDTKSSISSREASRRRMYRFLDWSNEPSAQIDIPILIILICINFKFKVVVS